MTAQATSATATMGPHPADETARENGWAQLTPGSPLMSRAGDALIVAGDTNSRYTRTADDLQWFVANNGLTLSDGTTFAHGGTGGTPATLTLETGVPGQPARLPGILQVR